MFILIFLFFLALCSSLAIFVSIAFCDPPSCPKRCNLKPLFCFQITYQFCYSLSYGQIVICFPSNFPFQVSYFNYVLLFVYFNFFSQFFLFLPSHHSGYWNIHDHIFTSKFHFFFLVFSSMFIIKSKLKYKLAFLFIVSNICWNFLTSDVLFHFY